MNALPPILRDQRKIDADHLKLLSIFHFVSAGFALLGVLFLLAHFLMFNMIISNPKLWQDQSQGPSPQEFFAIFRWFYLFMGIWFFTSGVINIISGLSMRAKKRRMFSLIVAGFNCLYIPLGTVLGIFTIVVLMRDSVRELY
jgi:hypothetical protein